MNWLSITFSIALFFTVALCYNASCPTCYSPSNPYWTMQRLLQDPLFYLLCVITPVAALLPRYTVADLWMRSCTGPLLKYLWPVSWIVSLINTRSLICLSQEPHNHLWNKCEMSWYLVLLCFPDISTGRVKALCSPVRCKLEGSWINSPLTPEGTSSAWAGSRWGHRSAPSLPSCPSPSPPLKVAIKKTRGASPAPRHHWPKKGPSYKQMKRRAREAHWGPQTVRRASQISTH